MIPEVLGDLAVADANLDLLVPFGVVFVIVNAIGLELIRRPSRIGSSFATVDGRLAISVEVVCVVFVVL